MVSKTPRADYVAFDRVADMYNTSRYVPPDVLRCVARLIFQDSGMDAASPFLDAGAGTGRFASPLAAEGLQVVGIDVSPGMLAQARAADARLGLLRADLRAVPLRTASMGGALVVHILHLIADWHGVVRELRRVLRPGAALYMGLEEGKHFRTRSLYFRIAEERKLMRPHIGAPNFAAILEHLEQTGAEVVRIESKGLHWTAAIQVRDLVQMLRRNAYSHLWHVPAEVHRDLVAELERRLGSLRADPNDVEEAPAHIALWSARWPEDRSET